MKWHNAPQTQTHKLWNVMSHCEMPYTARWMPLLVHLCVLPECPTIFHFRQMVKEDFTPLVYIQDALKCSDLSILGMNILGELQSSIHDPSVAWGVLMCRARPQPSPLSSPQANPHQGQPRGTRACGTWVFFLACVERGRKFFRQLQALDLPQLSHRCFLWNIMPHPLPRDP